MAEVITVYVGGRTLSFTGPAEWLERPTDAEIDRRLTEAPIGDFEREHARGQHKHGFIETRIQLEYFCTGPGDLHTVCRKHGVQVQSHPRHRGRRLR